MVLWSFSRTSTSGFRSVGGAFATASAIDLRPGARSVATVALEVEIAVSFAQTQVSSKTTAVRSIGAGSSAPGAVMATSIFATTFARVSMATAIAWQH